MSEALERNKHNAIAFHDLMFNQCLPAEAMERYAGDTCIQHNPHVAEGSLVVLHCHQEWPADANKDWAGTDIFRFDEAGKIVEHWDVLQVVPGQFANGNTMF